MFTNSYFPQNYFPPNYFPKTGEGTLSVLGHSPKVGGQLYIQAYMEWLKKRKVLVRRKVSHQVLSKSVLDWRQKQLTKEKTEAENAMYAVLLAEI